MTYKKHEGFTLVEIIVSVAALSLICALVLQLFLLAGDVNKRSEKKQHAVLTAASVIEIIKTEESLEALLDNDSFKDVVSTVSGKNVTLVRTTTDGMIVSIILGYNAEYSSENGDHFEISVSIYDQNSLIYTLEGGVYFAK